MILYTSMPHELVFPTEAAEYNKQMMVTQNGIPLLVEMEGGKECTEIRVMSSDPTHFMDEKYTPGTKITLA